MNKRIAPAFDFMMEHPKATLSFLADAGRGHFDYADRTVKYLAIRVMPISGVSSNRQLFMRSLTATELFKNSPFLRFPIRMRD